MTGKLTESAPPQSSRRDFIKKGSSLLVAGGVAGSTLSLAKAAHSFGSDTIKIGLVGSVGRVRLVRRIKVFRCWSLKSLP